MAQNKTQDEAVNNDDLFKVIIIEGVVCEARSGKSRFSEEIKNRIAIKCDSIPYDDIHAYDSSGARLTPKWYKEKTGYINMASVYNIPVKTAKGTQIDFEDWISNFNALGSEVRVSIIQKEGAMYPKAIKVLKDGEARDPFEDL